MEGDVNFPSFGAMNGINDVLRFFAKIYMSPNDTARLEHVQKANEFLGICRTYTGKLDDDMMTEQAFTGRQGNTCGHVVYIGV